MELFVLGTGSSGNCTVLVADGERLLIDAGIGPVRATERMRHLGADLVTSRPPVGILLTHDHGDHAARALPLSRALRAPLLAHSGVKLPRARRRTRVLDYVPGRPFSIGPFLVETIGVPHDAPHVAVRVSAGAARVAIATDLGHVPRNVAAFLCDSDVVLLEANYCTHMLEAGPYPERLKRRVGGPIGHLGNTQAAQLAARFENTRVGLLALVHLSRVNNTPERALETVRASAPKLSVAVLDHGESGRFEAVSRRPSQLEFAF